MSLARRCRTRVWGRSAILIAGIVGGGVGGTILMAIVGIIKAQMAKK
jgi:hypothetical protein